jgi:hypothetical protein
VEYEFNLDEVYNTPKYAVTDGPLSTKDAPPCTAPSKLTVPANTSIEDALHIIMRNCPQVTAEMSDGVKDDEGKIIHYEYKILSAVESTPGDGGQIRYKVKYLIQRFQRPKDASLFELAASVSQLNLPVGAQNDLTLVPPEQVNKLSPAQQKLRNNLISFDYLYTGKNVDILEFEMKMNLGLAYLQIATINNTLKDQNQIVPTSRIHIPQYDLDKVVRFGAPAQIPVFFGSQIRTPAMRNKQNSSQHAEAGYSLTKHSSIEVQDVTMRIHGNPRLLSTCNRTTSPANLGIPPTEQNNNPVTDEANFRDWSTFPSFAKVNIKMPRNNDDISLFRGEAVQDPDAIGGADFTRDFWFTGFYYVIEIEHSFDSGEFTQQLSMIGIPQNDTFKTINKQGKSAEQFQLQQNTLDCYDSALGLNVDPSTSSAASAKKPVDTGASSKGKSNPPPTIPHNKAGLTSYVVTNLTDTNVATRKVDPKKVTGWTGAAPEVQKAIKTAAEANGVDLGYMVMLAKAQSNFNPTVTKDNGGVGLYQFADSKWRVEVESNFGAQLGLEPLDTVEQRQNSLNKRTNPTTNASAAAMLTRSHVNRLRVALDLNGYTPPATDLYLAFVMTPEQAAGLIGAPDQSKDVTTVLSPTTYELFIENNPSYARYRTISDFRQHNAEQLVKGTNGIVEVVKANTTTTGQTTSVSPSENTGRENSAAAQLENNTGEQAQVAGTTPNKGCSETPNS